MIFEIEKILFFMIDDQKKRQEIVGMILRYGEQCKQSSLTSISEKLKINYEDACRKLERKEEELKYYEDMIRRIREVTCEECQ